MYGPSDNTPPDVERLQTPEQGVDWLKLARDAYSSSTTYVDANYRKNWEDSIRAFHNQHPRDSKYNSPAFDKRSSIFRPKTRSVIRKNEAIAAAAFFSNMDVVSFAAENDADPKQRIGAELMKQVVQYRLTKSVPWFQFLLGGLQDAQTQSVACARVEWKYREEAGKVVEDRPWPELIPVENIRIDPGAAWYDPVGTSPYLIELMPMYVGAVKARMNEPDRQGRTWRAYDDAVISAAMNGTPDTTRLARNRNNEDPHTQNKAVSDYQIVWVQRHIHRHEGRDWQFYTLGCEQMLTDPEPLEATVFHGERPYVIGVAILETHRVFPDSVPMLTKGLQDEANEVANQRLDNVKFVLNKKYGVRRGRNVDINALLRNVPGAVIMSDDPANDIVEYNWPDVTASSFAEQDRINADFDSLIGTFDQGSVNTNRKLNETVGGMQMAGQSANILTEYMLRTFTETFVEPVLRQIVKLEAKYETDQTVLAIAAQKAKLFPRYGINRATDDMLSADLLIKVNSSMGAIDPMMKLQKFAMAMTTYANLLQIPGLNHEEAGKEIFGHAGYQDGSRFFQQQIDPKVAQLQQQLQQAVQIIQQQGMALESKQQETQAKLAQTQQQTQADLAKTRMTLAAKQQETGLKIRADLTKEQMKQRGENQRALASAAVAMNKPKPKDTGAA